MKDYEQAMLNAAGRLWEVHSAMLGTASEQDYFQSRPSTRYKPTLRIDGDKWCALYGTNLMEGVAGFGDSPEKAYLDFDRAWHEPLKVLQNMQQVTP